MADYSDLTSRLRPSLPSCPDVSIEGAIARTARDFCSKHGVYRATLSDFNTVASTRDYVLSTPAGTQVSNILWVTYNDNELLQYGERGLQADDEEWETREGTPTAYTQLTKSELSLFPIPNAVKAVSVRLELKPTLAATSIDDDVYDEWNQAFEYGALVKLLTIPKKEWSDPALALYYKELYEDELRKASSGLNGKRPTVVKYGGL
ncbi:MAG: hypothetical protein HOE82_08530 [Gammaproteobacteria bacterium]|nr:hypothetical protein [Gammaproteobacteria bacterium]